MNSFVKGILLTSTLAVDPVDEKTTRTENASRKIEIEATTKNLLEPRNVDDCCGA
jgi:hypothetical protein